jgi:hypothetical protein
MSKIHKNSKPPAGESGSVLSKHVIHQAKKTTENDSWDNLWETWGLQKWALNEFRIQNELRLAAS